MREIRTSGSVGGPPSTTASAVAYPDVRQASLVREDEMI
jgi:hypothetical protein